MPLINLASLRLPCILLLGRVFITANISPVEWVNEVLLATICYVLSGVD